MTLSHGAYRMHKLGLFKKNGKIPVLFIDIETALIIAEQCLTRYRLPEPTRMADTFSKCKTIPALL